MKNLKLIAFSIAFMLVGNIYVAQNKWSAEFRPNLDFPTQDIGDNDPRTGFGFEVAVAYNFMEHLDAYVGWGYNTFKTTSSATDFDNDVDETGYTFGLQFIHPISEGSKFSYLVRAGGIYNHLEFEDSKGNITYDTGHGLGYEFGLGLDYRFSESWHLRPQIGYRALSRDFDIDDVIDNVDLNYVAFGIGIIKSF